MFIFKRNNLDNYKKLNATISFSFIIFMKHTHYPSETTQFEQL